MLVWFLAFIGAWYLLSIVVMVLCILFVGARHREADQ